MSRNTLSGGNLRRSRWLSMTRWRPNPRIALAVCAIASTSSMLAGCSFVETSGPAEPNTNQSVKPRSVRIPSEIHYAPNSAELIAVAGSSNVYWRVRETADTGLSIGFCVSASDGGGRGLGVNCYDDNQVRLNQAFQSTPNPNQGWDLIGLVPPSVRRVRIRTRAGSITATASRGIFAVQASSPALRYVAVR